MLAVRLSGVHAKTLVRQIQPATLAEFDLARCVALLGNLPMNLFSPMIRFSRYPPAASLAMVRVAVWRRSILAELSDRHPVSALLARFVDSLEDHVSTQGNT